MENIKVGDYCYERFRDTTNKEDRLFKQGMGLEGEILKIKDHPVNGRIVEFDSKSSFRFCELAWITKDKELKDVVIPLAEANIIRQTQMFGYMNPNQIPKDKNPEDYKKYDYGKPVDILEYQKNVVAQFNENPTGVELLDMLHALVGMSEESGEVLGEYKKIIFHGKKKDKDKIIGEFGDQLWYYLNAIKLAGLSLNEIIEHNKDKLKVRYPKGRTKNIFNQSLLKLSEYEN
jgi:NTP pyrophosphatase (non-canonical NTP hydrolase)